jgi:N-acetylglucosamine kinase-like BadF-type ATPase
MSTTVAIDGGQSGLRLRCLPSGATGSARGFSYQAGDGNVAATAFAVEAAARAAGLSEPVDVVCAGLSGAPADPLLRSRLAARIAQALDAREVRLCPDMVTAHAGALGGAAGAVLAAGTGVVCLGVGADGRTHRVDGWGHLFGDAGSAFAIGRAGLVAVHRAGDGRADATLLSELARRAYDVELSQLAQSLYISTAVVSEVARFAPYVVEAAVAGDAAALEIVEQAASDLARTAATAARAVDVTTVAYTGRLFEAGPVLLKPFATELAPGWFRGRICSPRKGIRWTAPSGWRRVRWARTSSSCTCPGPSRDPPIRNCRSRAAR